MRFFCLLNGGTKLCLSFKKCVSSVWSSFAPRSPFNTACIITNSFCLDTFLSNNKHFNSNFCLLNNLASIPTAASNDKNHRITKQAANSTVNFLSNLLIFKANKSVITRLLPHPSFSIHRRERELFLKLLQSETLALYKSHPHRVSELCLKTYVIEEKESNHKVNWDHLVIGQRGLPAVVGIFC